MKNINPNIKSRKQDIDVDQLISQIEKDDRSALGKAITLLESEKPTDRKNAKKLLNWALASQKESLRIGITGVPVQVKVHL